jgi:hypothetical protein
MGMDLVTTGLVAMNGGAVMRPQDLWCNALDFTSTMTTETPIAALSPCTHACAVTINTYMFHSDTSIHAAGTTTFFFFCKTAVSARSQRVAITKLGIVPYFFQEHGCG